jgi:hypothetical protein
MYLRFSLLNFFMTFPVQTSMKQTLYPPHVATILVYPVEEPGQGSNAAFQI